PAHRIGRAAAGLSLLGALAMVPQGTGPGFSQVEEIAWIPSLGSAYRVGVDGISLPLFLLTTVLFLVSLVFSTRVTDRTPAYVAFFLMLETTCLGRSRRSTWCCSMSFSSSRLSRCTSSSRAGVTRIASERPFCSSCIRYWAACRSCSALSRFIWARTPTHSTCGGWWPAHLSQVLPVP